MMSMASSCCNTQELVTSYQSSPEDQRKEMAMQSSETAIRARLGQQAALLEQKQQRLSALIDTLDNAVVKLKKDASISLENLHTHKETQLNSIAEQYDELEQQLTTSTDKVVEELSSFIEKVIMDRRKQIQDARNLMKEALASKDSIAAEADIMETSLNRIINSQLPDLTLSQLFEFKSTGEVHRKIEMEVVESKSSLLPANDKDKDDENDTLKPGNKKLDCQGDYYAPEISDTTSVSESAAISGLNEEVNYDEKEPLQQRSPSPASAPAPCSLVSFSKSIAQSQIPGFSSHVAHAGAHSFIVDSFAPAIYKIGKKEEIEKLITVDPCHAVVGLAVSNDYLYVQYMNVTDYHRAVFVYTTEDGQFIKRWDTPNLLGSSIALVRGHLIISSRDKLMVCSPTGKHIKDIAVSPSCVKTLSSVSNDAVILCSTAGNLVMRINVESGTVVWRSNAIEAPVCTAADNFGRVYVLVQPSVIYVMDAQTGDLLMQSTLSCPGGIIEGICLTGEGLLLTAISYRGNKSNPGCHSVLNTFRIEGVC